MKYIGKTIFPSCRCWLVAVFSVQSSEKRSCPVALYVLGSLVLGPTFSQLSLFPALIAKLQGKISASRARSISIHSDFDEECQKIPIPNTKVLHFSPCFSWKVHWEYAITSNYWTCDMFVVKMTCTWTFVWCILGTEYSAVKSVHMYAQWPKIFRYM